MHLWIESYFSQEDTRKWVLVSVIRLMLVTNYGYMFWVYSENTVNSWLFNSQDLLRESYLTLSLHFKQKGDERKEKYWLKDIDWFSKKFSKQKWREMYGRQCWVLMFWSWKWKVFTHLVILLISPSFKIQHVITKTCSKVQCQIYELSVCCDQLFS